MPLKAKRKFEVILGDASPRLVYRNGKVKAVVVNAYDEIDAIALARSREYLRVVESVRPLPIIDE